MEDLRKLFTSLNIESEILPDLNHDQLLDQTKEFGRDDTFKDASMSVYVIMAHGGMDSLIYPKDGKPVTMEDLVELFDDTKCPNLAGKPKWFIFQVSEFDSVSYHKYPAL